MAKPRIKHLLEYPLSQAELDKITADTAHQAHQAGIDEAVERMDKLAKQTFPRGERRWCIECAERLKKALQDNK